MEGHNRHLLSIDTYLYREKCIYCISEKEKGAAMYSVLQPVLDVLNERLDRARGRGDHAAVLILEGEIRKLTAKMVGLRTQ
jgi:hypothetical protein